MLLSMRSIDRPARRRAWGTLYTGAPVKGRWFIWYCNHASLHHCLGHHCLPCLRQDVACPYLRTLLPRPPVVSGMVENGHIVLAPCRLTAYPVTDGIHCSSDLHPGYALARGLLPACKLSACSLCLAGCSVPVDHLQQWHDPQLQSCQEATVRVECLNAI